MKWLLTASMASMLGWGQCAMCFRNAEALDRQRAGALHAGIAVILAPLLACASIIGRVAYRRRRQI